MNTPKVIGCSWATEDPIQDARKAAEAMHKLALLSRSNATNAAAAVMLLARQAYSPPKPDPRLVRWVQKL